MPVTKSAEKAMRASRRKRVVNLSTIRKYKDAIKTVRKAIAGGERDKAEKALQDAYKQVDKASKKNVIHKNKAARLKSRLNRGVVKLETK